MFTQPTVACTCQLSAICSDVLDADFDWCTAPVEDEWFMATNTYFDILSPVNVLMDKGQIMIPYISESSQECMENERCRWGRYTASSLCCAVVVAATADCVG